MKLSVKGLVIALTTASCLINDAVGASLRASNNKEMVDVSPTTTAITTTCTDRTDCLATEVCIDSSCVESISYKMLNNIAEFATEDSTADYASTTSTTFASLFACTINDPTDQLMLQQHYVWKGFIDYALVNNNQIEINGDNGQLVVITDTWGDRCESSPNCNIDVSRYQECPAVGCDPKIQEYPLTGGSVLDIKIYEPCNYVSNLAYYRVMNQLCGNNLYMDAATSIAFNHAFAALAAGSANWHGSHTYLGYRADNQFIAVIAFLVHQLVIGGLATANKLNVQQDEALRTLMDLHDAPRSKTANQIAEYVTDFITTQDETEWSYELDNLDLPNYYTTFMVIVASILTIIFPDRPDTMSALLNGLSGVFGTDSDALNNEYLPPLQILTANLNLTDEQKFVLFRQLLGMAAKMVFAFLWQEQVLEVGLFLEPRTNQIAPQIIPPLISLFNFVTGYEHLDANFQEFNGMYPGDETCRETVPHAKWHEISANGLLDMTYMADCAAAIVTGSDTSSGCAHLVNLNGKGSITEQEIDAWVSATFEIPQIPIFEDIVRIFVTDIFLLFDVTGDDVIDWNDIVQMIDTAEDIADIFGSISSTIEDFISKFENFCIQDSDCDETNEFCNFLVFGCRPKRDNGFAPCLKDSQCYSDRCVDVTRVCAAKLSNGKVCTADKACLSGTCSSGICGDTCNTDSDCPSDWWCNGIGYSPNICRPMRPNGWGPCIADSQCLSDRCVDTTRICARKKNNGERCLANKECLSDNCRWFRCRR